MSDSMYLGVGATCTVLVRFLKPSKYIASAIVNPPKGAKQEGLLVCRKGDVIIKKKSQEVIFFRHEKFDREVYCQKRFARVTHNGPLASRFAEKAQTRRAAAVDDACPEGMRALPKEALTGQWTKEDAEKLRHEGFAVDDDNDPAEENDNPEHNRQLIADLGQDWGQVLQCERKKDGCNDSRPKLNGFSSELLQGISMIGMFFLFFPMKYLKSVVLVQTSKKIVAGGHRPLTLGELIKFLGIWLFLSSFKGSKRRDFWSTAPIDPHSGAPFRVHHWMSGRRFELILASLTYTDQDAPSYRDRFHYVRQLLQAFNDHMAEIFTPGWVSCLDESISIWLSKWTCPGWMFVPRKPHPFGNEYHTICDGLSGILFALEIVEGQDEPKEKPVSRTNRFGATTGLLLRLTRVLHQTGKVVILDSGFCVLKALVELKKVGVFASGGAC